MKEFFTGDAPIKSKSQDLFNMSYYADAISTFISESETPLTISIQGEWGSGKTSLINLISENLIKNNYMVNYEIIIIEAWEYFIGDSVNSIERFTLSLIDQIISRTDKKKLVKQMQKVNKYSAIFISKSFSMIGNMAKIDSKTIEDIKSFFCDNELLAIVQNLKNSLAELIRDSNKLCKKPKVFTFIIDDLDRIEPSSAVQILELLKNIFDIQQCIFILSVDFDIVTCGLKKRYDAYKDGTPFNYKDYFDKLIQLPFTMPVQSYNIEPLIVKILDEYGYWDKEALSLEEHIIITDVLKLCIGNNPRKIKRLANAIHLSYLIDIKTNHFLSSIQRKIINLILLCIQQAYPDIYNFLLLSPDFTSWNNKILADYMPNISNDDRSESLNNNKYPVEWEEVVHRLCEQQVGLRKSAMAVMKVFNYLNILIRENHYFIISHIIALSTSTNLNQKIQYDGTDYQNNSFTQFKQGQKLIQMIKPISNSRILDVGCGNGLTTIELFNKYGANASIDAFDISPSQIDIAIKNRDSHNISESNINFYVMDVNNLNKISHYNLVFSNSTLHWLSNQRGIYSKIYMSLKPDGYLAIHIGGKGNYRGLHQMVKVAYTNLGLMDYFCNWKFPVFYPSKDEIVDTLSEIGYKDIVVENVESNGSEYTTLIDDFAKASLIFYYERLPQEYHKKLENEFKKQCSINSLDLYTHRIYVLAKK